MLWPGLLRRTRNTYTNWETEEVTRGALICQKEPNKRERFTDTKEEDFRYYTTICILL